MRTGIICRKNGRVYFCRYETYQIYLSCYALVDDSQFYSNFFLYCMNAFGFYGGWDDA